METGGEAEAVSGQETPRGAAEARNRGSRAPTKAPKVTRRERETVQSIYLWGGAWGRSRASSRKVQVQDHFETTFNR